MSFRYRAAIRSWMFDEALPWWGEHGIDRQNGGYLEQMTLEGRDAGIPYKRTRVTARQIYVFSHAHMLGWNPGADLARHGFSLLTTKTWNGAERGFVRRLSLGGEIIDTTPDLYDHAFCLFAFAWFHKATGDSASRDWLHRTLDYLETHMRHPTQAGFQNELPQKGWRQQNPHMHLTEGLLAAFEATGDKRFADVAKEVVQLFCSRFFDMTSATLGEYFSEDWSRAPTNDGKIVEPGHQFEWAWILNNCRRQLGLELSQPIRAATGFAEANGVDPASGAVYNVVDFVGEPVDRNSRCWPNTERLKAAIALQDLDGVNPTPILESSCALMFSRYLNRRPKGTWTEIFDSNGKPIATNIPASTFYHFFLAFAEVLRVCEEGRVG